MPIEIDELEQLQQQDQEETPVQPIRPRRNPRLVFGNPEAFFLDLLMEQEEQM